MRRSRLAFAFVAIICSIGTTSCQQPPLEFKPVDVATVNPAISGPKDWTLQVARRGNVVAEDYRFPSRVTALRTVLVGGGDRNAWIGGEPRELLEQALQAESFKSRGFGLSTGRVEPVRGGLLYSERRERSTCAVYAGRLDIREDSDILRVWHCSVSTDEGEVRSLVERVVLRFFPRP